jgi:hypothetical protein
MSHVKGRPKGSNDSIDRSELPLRDRLLIVKKLCKDTSLTAKERLDACRLYSELQGDKKTDGFEKVMVLFTVVPDINVPVAFSDKYNGKTVEPLLNEPQEPVAPVIVVDTVDKPVPVIVVPEPIKEEPLIPPALPLQILKTDDELWQDTLSERDRARDTLNDKFMDGN